MGMLLPAAQLLLLLLCVPAGITCKLRTCVLHVLTELASKA